MFDPVFAERYPTFMKNSLNTPFPFLNEADCRLLAGKALAMSRYRDALASLVRSPIQPIDVSAELLALNWRNGAMRASCDRFYDEVLEHHQESENGVQFRSREWAPFTPNTAPFSTAELRLMQQQGIDWHPFRNVLESDPSVQDLKKKLRSFITKPNVKP